MIHFTSRTPAAKGARQRRGQLAAERRDLVVALGKVGAEEEGPHGRLQILRLYVVVCVVLGKGVTW